MNVLFIKMNRIYLSYFYKLTRYLTSQWNGLILNGIWHYIFWIKHNIILNEENKLTTL